MEGDYDIIGVYGKRRAMLLLILSIMHLKVMRVLDNNKYRRVMIEFLIRYKEYTYCINPSTMIFICLKCFQTLGEEHKFRFK